MADENETVVETETTEEKKGSEAPSQKVVRSEKETAAYNLKKQADKLREAGGDPAEVLGIKNRIALDESLPDDQPLTIGSLRELQKQEAKQTALQMAEEIEDEDEREKVVNILQTRIVPSGNAEADLRLAQAAANASRNARIAEDATRRTSPRRTAAGSSQSAPAEDEFVPTAAEARMMQKPYNLSKEKILEARQAAQR